jgi:hypothetical protein
VVLAVALAGCGAAAHSAPGTFAGYGWRGQVTSVAGTWRVPRIAVRSSDGRAATWIAAQDLRRGSSGDRDPFIQVGTVEERRSRDLYYAFWSDTARGFHLMELFPVRAGDTISSDLALDGGRWTVLIRDTTSGSADRFVTHEEGRARFRLAMWFQEDIVRRVGRHAALRPFPYPSLSAVRFGALAVDRRAPRRGRLEAVTMRVGSGDVTPSALERDSFTVPRRDPR